MKPQAHFSLASLNTMRMPAYAAWYVPVDSQKTLQEVLDLRLHPKVFVLSGGSNMLLTQDLDALVLHVAIKGIEITHESKDEVILKVGAGETWHDLVMHCVNNNWGGLENLALIPGYVGAAPIQNIGAYGVEQKDCFVRCGAYALTDGHERIFDLKACQFGYRDSIFKREARDQYMIGWVEYRLTKKKHTLHLSYGAISQVLEQNQIHAPSIADVAEAVQSIRRSKLPDPKLLGNAGSFFKNPVIPALEAAKLSAQYPDLPVFEAQAGWKKIPAGWLIEKAGYKGYRSKNCGVYDKQALVLVNHGGATGAEMWALAQEIQEAVREKFGVEISPEVPIF
ncbi:MAG: UDP-N-acetylmuramate dehydrogenase [Flavobacteriaceae bacterium]